MLFIQGEQVGAGNRAGEGRGLWESVILDLNPGHPLKG